MVASISMVTGLVAKQFCHVLQSVYSLYLVALHILLRLSLPLRHGLSVVGHCHRFLGGGEGREGGGGEEGEGREGREGRGGRERKGSGD